MSTFFRLVTLSAFVFACDVLWIPSIVLGQSQVDDSNHKLIDPAVLLEKPPAVPAHLRELFDRMEAANRRSQDVFRKLSTSQMNFQPSNGTHTPRWNAEHMAGRQLLFFSQIYHALDPTIPVFDWNPAQMPID